MFNGKNKALTFSFDDGVTQDKRLISLFNKYGMKATFNLNSSYLGQFSEIVREGVAVRHDKVPAEELRTVYKNHEIASHTLTHPMLPGADEEFIIDQVESDRIKLSELAGYEVKGFAYPGGGKNFDERVAEIIAKNTGALYARTTLESYDFEPQKDLFVFRPTVKAMNFNEFERLANEFVNLKTDSEKIFYVWGHAYEFDIADTWDRLENILKILAFRDDIFYGTNAEVLLK